MSESPQPMEAPPPKPSRLRPKLEKAAVVVGIAVFLVVAFLLVRSGGIETEGVVKDASNDQPIPGAIVAGSKKRVTTNEQGRFTLKVQRQTKMLSVVAEGYESKQVEPEPSLIIHLPPAPPKVVEQWLADWQAGEYSRMYAALSQDFRRNTSRKDFTEELVKSLFEVEKVKLGQAQMEGVAAQVPATLEMVTPLGRKTIEHIFNLVKEKGLWRIQWSRGEPTLEEEVSDEPASH